MRLKWDWHDIFVILDAAVIVHEELPGARDAFKELIETDVIIAPVYSQLEATYAQVMEDGKINYKDIWPVVMNLMPLVMQWGILKAALKNAAQNNPEISPIYYALDRVYVALTT